MTDYAELLATKSQELAELTRAFNQRRYDDAHVLARRLKRDFAELECIADELQTNQVDLEAVARGY